MNFVNLTNDKLSVESIYTMVCSPQFGAVSLFVGTTRDNFEGKSVTKLEYEAYEQMAVKSLQNICTTIREKFNVGNIAIYHRLGDVPITEASVVIAISAVHRSSALKAVPYAIDALKADVPIWKKEVYGDGHSSEWKENPESTNVSTLNDPEGFHLYEEIVEANNENEVSSDLIQVKANLEEINRRINSFMCRKRQQINLNNIQNFCWNNLENSEKGSCARVSALLRRRKDSNSHLKIHRVENTIGPQIQSSHASSTTLLCETSNRDRICPPGAEERLSNAESYLNINESSADVFSRLKAVEDRILYLESISPEYFNIEKQCWCKIREKATTSKRAYSSLELDSKVQDLEAKLQKKKYSVNT